MNSGLHQSRKLLESVLSWTPAPVGARHLGTGITKVVSHCKNWQKIYQMYRVSLRGIDTFSRETTVKFLLLLFEKGAILKGENAPFRNGGGG